MGEEAGCRRRAVDDVGRLQSRRRGSYIPGAFLMVQLVVELDGVGLSNAIRLVASRVRGGAGGAGWASNARRRRIGHLSTEVVWMFC